MHLYYTFINNNKTFIYNLYALVCIYTFINKIYIYNLYPLVYGRLRSSSSSTLYKVFPRRNGLRRSVSAMKWLATKCPRNEMPGDEVSLRRNGWQRSVLATKWQAMKQQRRNSGDEKGCTHKNQLVNSKEQHSVDGA